MKIVISSGHGKYISGAVGPSPWGIHEHTEAVKVVNEAAAVMRSMGVEVITYEDTVSKSQNENLDRIVAFHNNQGAHDLDVSIHFNSTDPQPSGPVGSEVFYASSAGQKVADRTVDKICTASGLKNRGPKSGNFAFLNNTNEVAVLVEVCFVNSHADVDIYRDRFSEICVAIAEGLTDEQAGQQPDRPPVPERPPEPPGPDVDSHPTLKKGDQGEAVARLQRSLGIPADGDFGSITDTWVRAFQAACELTADGVVGPMTWAEVDALDTRMANGNSGIDAEMMSDIDRLVVASGLDDYTWDDRGTSYPGYISGMAMSFAVAMQMFQTGKASAQAMAKPLGSPDKDAMEWYSDQFDDEGMDNGTSRERIRHLFVLLIGLGMRESSGKYCEGRDMSASNTSSDTCEAGLFQSSWNFHNSSSHIEELFHEYWADPNGFLDIFSEGIYPSSNNLSTYGTGDGAAYQFLAKFCPAFAVMSTAVGLRVLKDHWGPIKRHEAEIVPEVDELLEKIQELVEGTSEDEPEIA
jgi:hypothetical protein